MPLGVWMREDNPLIVDGQARRLLLVLMWVMVVGVLVEVAAVAVDVCTAVVKRTSDIIKN
jgi:hypothetical protein